MSLNGENKEEVECSRFLALNGTMEAEVSRRVDEGTKVLVALTNVWEVRSPFGRVKLDIFEDVVVSSIFYRCEVLGYR